MCCGDASSTKEVPLESAESGFVRVISTPWINTAGHVGGWVRRSPGIAEFEVTARLQEREQRLRLALDVSRGGSWTWDARTNRADWDDRFREIYGFTADEPATSEGWPGRVHADDRKRVLSVLDEVLQAKRSSWDNTFRIVRPDGTMAWIESLGQAYRDADGQIIRLTGLDLDVTERRRAEEALRESEEREVFLLRLMDALRPLSDPGAMQEVATRLLGEHLHVNRVNCSDVEGSEFILRRSYVNGVAPWIARGPISTFGQSLIKGHSLREPLLVNNVHTDPGFTESERTTLLGYEIAAFAAVLLVKDKRWVAVLAVHNAKPRVWTKGEIDLLRDVAQRIWEAIERARAQDALREREERLAFALDASAAGVWTWDPVANRTTWDARLFAQYGYAPGAPQTFETWISSVHEEDRPKVLAHLEDVVRGRQKEWNVVFRAVRTDGNVVWMHALGRAEHAPDGRMTKMTGINLDITERRRAEEALQAQRDEERDRTLQLLLETAPLGILSVDGRGVIVTANSSR